MKAPTLSRQMWQIAIPAIISNLSIPLLGLADAFIMGHLPSPAYLGAVALGAMMFSLLYNSVNFLRMATTGLTAQASVRADDIAITQICLRASLIAIGIGLLFIILQWPITDLIFSLTKAENEIETLSKEYFHIRIWGAPFALLNFVAVGWLLGMHKAKHALVIQLFMNICNISLNFLFVYGFNMDVDGVALGTVVSEILACFLAYLIIANQSIKLFDKKILHAHFRQDIFDRGEFFKLFRLNRDIFIRTACLTGSMAAFTILGANMGREILAANAILMNLQMVTSYGLDGFAQAAEVLVGKEIGRKSRKGLRDVVIISGKWALITATVFSAVYLVFGEVIVNTLTNLSDVRITAGQYLIWVIALPIISVWSFQFDGIFIGATAGKYMRNGMIVSTIVYVAALAAFIPLWNNHGLWLSYSLFLITRAITLAIEYPKIIPKA